VGHGEHTTQKKSIPVSIPARLGPAMSSNPSEPILYQSCHYIGLIDNAVTSIQPYTNMIGWLGCAMVWGECECGFTMYNHNP